MLLSDRDILREIGRGRIKIDPFNEEQLQANGYDVRIGPTYYTIKEGINSFFPFLKELVNEVYEKKIAKWEVLDVNGRRIRGRFIKIPPQGFAVAATIERTKTDVDIAASLRCRSSLARAGLSIARCAGWGDIGFDGVWTIEIVNHLNVPYYLPVELRVGQLIFIRTESPSRRVYNGKYMYSEEPVLPKLYADEELATMIAVE